MRVQGKRAPYPYRWENKDYDTLVDEMGTLPADDPKFMELFHKAMEI
ncbi:hypothetical protein BH10CHL1_BH10CHL1_48530 [soil metagenome]